MGKPTKNDIDIVLEKIKDEMNRVNYGNIKVVMNRTSDSIDIVTEHRQRIRKELSTIDNKDRSINTKYKVEE